MRERRRKIKRTTNIVFKTCVAFAVFFISVVSVPALQAFWQNSGIMGSVFNTAGSGFHREKYAVIGDAVIEIEIVSSAEDRIRGLSGRNHLLNHHGMWFVFPKSDLHGIWMKDMKFSIDIIWINENMTIVDVAEDVSPTSFPQVFFPQVPAKYILEVPAGYTKNEGIKISDQVNLL